MGQMAFYGVAEKATVRRRCRSNDLEEARETCIYLRRGDEGVGNEEPVEVTGKELQRSEGRTKRRRRPGSRVTERKMEEGKS